MTIMPALCACGFWRSSVCIGKNSHYRPLRPLPPLQSWCVLFKVVLGSYHSTYGVGQGVCMQLPPLPVGHPHSAPAKGPLHAPPQPGVAPLVAVVERKMGGTVCLHRHTLCGHCGGVG